MDFTPEQITVFGTATVVMAPTILKTVVGLFRDKVKEIDDHAERLIKLEGRVERAEKDITPIAKMERDIAAAHMRLRNIESQRKEQS